MTDIVKIRPAQEFLDNIFWRDVDDLNLTVRASNLLRAEGIRRNIDLVLRTAEEIIRVPNCGRRTLNEIREVLEAQGLTFGMAPLEGFGSGERAGFIQGLEEKRAAGLNGQSAIRENTKAVICTIIGTLMPLPDAMKITTDPKTVEMLAGFYAAADALVQRGCGISTLTLAKLLDEGRPQLVANTLNPGRSPG